MNDSSSASSPARLSLLAQLKSRVQSVVLHTAAAFALCSLVVALGPGDRWIFTAPLFRALPLPAIGVLLALLGTVALFRHAKRRAIIALAAALAIAILSGIQLWKSSATTQRLVDKERPQSRILLWNTAEGFTGIQSIATAVANSNAEFSVLFEAPPAEECAEDFANTKIGAILIPLSEDTLLVSRTRIGDIIRMGNIYKVEALIAQRWTQVFVVRMPSNPFASRQDIVEKLAEQIQAMGSEPYLICGEFEAPRNSPVLAKLFASQQLQSAFDQAGLGWDATWPAIMPLYSSSQVWLTNSWRATAAGSQFSLRSDHLPWIVDLESVER